MHLDRRPADHQSLGDIWIAETLHQQRQHLHLAPGQVFAQGIFFLVWLNERLERFRGHFLNWYDTRTLEPRLPRYVSTVDSGNFAACLRILGQACQHIPTTPVLRWERWEGMADTFALLDDFVRDLETAKNISAAGELRLLTGELRERVLRVKDDPDAWLPALDYVVGEGWQRLLPSHRSNKKCLARAIRFRPMFRASRRDDDAAARCWAAADSDSDRWPPNVRTTRCPR